MRRSNQIQKRPQPSKKWKVRKWLLSWAAMVPKPRHMPKREASQWYDDAQELIDDEEVNAIYIATPPSSHATYAIMAMKAGKPVYIEKPMAVTYEECCRINRISNETGVPCFVAYYRRYLPYFLKVKELAESGTIGNIINIQIRFCPTTQSLGLQQREPALARTTRHCRRRLLLRLGSTPDRPVARHVRLHSRSQRI